MAIERERLTSTWAVWAWAPRLLQKVLGRGRHQGARAYLGPRLQEMEPRDAALRGMLWSAPLAALTVVAIYALSQDRRFEAALKLLGPFSALFLVPLLGHAVQLVTNVWSSELSDQWDELAGWQRGVFGVIAVFLAGGVILSLAFLVGMRLGHLPGGE